MRVLTHEVLRGLRGKEKGQGDRGGGGKKKWGVQRVRGEEKGEAKRVGAKGAEQKGVGSTARLERRQKRQSKEGVRGTKS